VQKVVPDAIEYLRSHGVPVPPSGNRGGTLRVVFSEMSSQSDVAASVRTTAAVANGRAGLSYAAFPTPNALLGTWFLCGLRQNTADRSNVAILNAGGPNDGDVVLRLTVYSGSTTHTLPDETLSPGGFKQFSEILGGLGLTTGFVKVERVSGTARYYTYGVINDQANSDGSFVPPIPAPVYGYSIRGFTLPVVVETGAFTTELVLTNVTTSSKTLRLTYTADAIQHADSSARQTITLGQGEQRIIPAFVQYLRSQGASGIGPPGPTFAGALFVTDDQSSHDVAGVFVGGRTSTPGGGGRYGLFYGAVPFGNAAAETAWLYGLQQNGENRTNVALINTGEKDSSTDVFRIELFDGDNGTPVGTADGLSLAPNRWFQIGTILAQYSPSTTNGYAKVTRISGANPFVAYAVVNDGAQPNERSGDGAYVAMQP
jgi:hypothetical protein